jgi:hypothetical protein
MGQEGYEMTMIQCDTRQDRRAWNICKSKKPWAMKRRKHKDFINNKKKGSNALRLAYIWEASGSNLGPYILQNSSIVPDAIIQTVAASFQLPTGHAGPCLHGFT